MAKKGHIPWNKGLKNWLVISDEMKYKMGSSLRGKKRPPRSKEWIAKLAAARRGIHHTEEAKRRISQYQKLHPNSGRFKKGDKPKNTGIRSGKYTISRWHQDYDYALTIRKDCCDVCGVLEKDLTRKLSFDHDHVTNRFRGWLCGRCNTALGHVKDNPNILQALIDYLNNSKI